MRPSGGLQAALKWMTLSLMLASCGGGDPKDDIAPAIRFTFPAEFTILSGMETIRAIANDNDEIKEVEFLLDGETLTVLTSSPYVIQLNTAAYPDCTDVASAVTVTAVAVDPAGNKGVAERIFYLDNEGLPPLPVAMLPAQVVTKHTATVAWSQSAEYDFSHYTLYRDTSETVTQASDSLTSIAVRTTTSFTDPGTGVTPFGLDENSDYTYRVYIVDERGAATPSDSVTRVHTLLPQPINLSAGASITKYTALLSWVASTEDVAYYRLHRGLTGMEADLDSLTLFGPSITSYIDTGLTAASDYFYYLYLVDSAAYSDTFAVGNVVAVTTDSLDTPILVPSAQGVSKYVATLQWLRVPVQEDSSWIALYRSTSGSVDSNSTQVMLQNVVGSGIIFTDEGLAQGQDYRFAMRHHDSRNNIKWSAEVELTTLTISDVWSGGLGVSDQQKYSLGLTWDPYTYLPDDFASYSLTRDGGVEVFTSSVSSEANITDFGLQRKTTYSYTLTVTDTSGAQASVSTDATTSDILPAEITLVEPTILWFFKLEWLPSPEPEFAHYSVVRSNDENEIFDDLDDDNVADCVASGDCALVYVRFDQNPAAGDSVISFEDNDPNLIAGELTALPVYRYAVLTYDTPGGYSASNIAGDTLYAAPNAVTLSYDSNADASTTTIPIAWTQADWNYPALNTLLFERYEVWRNTVKDESPDDAETTYQQVATFDDINIITFTDGGINGQFAYRIVLVDKVGRSAISNEIFPATLP